MTGVPVSTLDYLGLVMQMLCGAVSRPPSSVVLQEVHRGRDRREVALLLVKGERGARGLGRLVPPIGGAKRERERPPCVSALVGRLSVLDRKSVV